MRAVLATALELVSERRCGACDEPLRRRALLCATCAETVVREPPPRWRRGQAGATAAYARYGGAIADAIQLLKYRGRPDLAGPMGQLLGELTVAARDRWQLVVPVPLHPRRLADRGYNQAALLARPLSARLGVPLSTESLVRRVDTPPQARLDGRTRRAQLRGAFALTRRGRVAGRALLLVDDVTTTGATLDACRRPLLEAGARRVDALVVARAEVDPGSHG